MNDPFIDPGVGLITVGERLFCRVPLQPLAQQDGDVPEVAQRSCTVPDLGVLQRVASRLHRIDEILLVGLEWKMYLAFFDD